MNIWENTVLTDKGRALLVKLFAGSSLHITRAATGTGYVTPGLLAQQTAVSGEKQALNFRPVGYPEEGKCAVTCNLTNDDLTAGYLAKQIGLYATDPDNGEILFMLSQAPSEKGTEVPSASEMPGYSAEWTFYIQYGQADGVTVNVTPAGTVSRTEMDAELAKKAPRQFVMNLTYGADMESCTIDKSFAELQEAYQAGSQIRLVDQSGMEYEMVAFGAGYMAYFVHQMNSERYLVGFNANGKVSYSSTATYTEENPPTAAAIGAVQSVATYYPLTSAKSADDLTDSFALIPVSADVNPDLFNIVGGTFAYVHTSFYIESSTTARRMQIATTYNSINPKMAMRIYGANGWLTWREIADTDYAVNKAGDKMTGTLAIEKSWPNLALQDPTTGRKFLIEGNSNTGAIALYSIKDESNRSQLDLNPETTSSDGLLVLHTKIEGKEAAAYNVLHAGNKHLITPADIGAAATTAIEVDTSSTAPSYALDPSSTNVEKRYLASNGLTSITLTKGSFLNNTEYHVTVIFKSGATATTITNTAGVYFTGDDCKDGVLTPVKNKVYELGIWWNGLSLQGVVRGV